jgi:hypothetical protein
MCYFATSHQFSATPGVAWFRCTQCGQSAVCVGCCKEYGLKVPEDVATFACPRHGASTLTTRSRPPKVVKESPYTQPNLWEGQ